MNPNCPTTLPLAKQQLCCEVVAAAIERGNVAPDQLLRMLSAEVGHTESDVIYAENKLDLHYYEPEDRRHETPIFVVYALINRPYILDLQPDRSVVRRLLEAGFPVYLVDWDEPSRLDAHLTLTDYVCRYLDNCVAEVLAHAETDDLHLMGYCMGGTMAAMYAARNPEPVRTLTWMAMPYSFEGDAGILERWARYFDPDSAVDAMGNVPGDLLAVEFSLMDPIEHYFGKYVRLYENIDDPDFVENFTRMERWIWDGVDVAGETFREFVDELYRKNQLVTGEFELGGAPVDVSTIDVPVLGIVGQYDHIVPPASSTPFMEHVDSDDTRLIEFSAGHIGISVASAAHEQLWPAVTDWFGERSAPIEARGQASRAPDSVTGVEAPEESSGTTDRERARRAVQSVAQQAAARMAAADDPVTVATRRVGDPETATATVAATDPVDAVEGIGDTYAARLTDAGIDTVGDLREYDPETLAGIVDVSPRRTEAWLDQLT